MSLRELKPRRNYLIFQYIFRGYQISYRKTNAVFIPLIRFASYFYNSGNIFRFRLTKLGNFIYFRKKLNIHPS